MNAAAPLRTSRWFSLPRSASISPGALTSTHDFCSLFVLGSVVLHLGLLAIVSSKLDIAHASYAPTQEIEIAMASVEERVFVPPPLKALPLGQLDAPTVKRSQRPKNIATPNAPSAQEPTTAAPSPSEALPLLTVSNPYASANAATFTSGSANSVSKTVLVTGKAQNATPQFGAQSGSQSFSKDRALALNAWYKKVRAQLSRLASRAYPRRSQKLGHEGTTKITVRISEAGRVLSASVTRQSPYAGLDRAALNGIQSIKTVAAPPSGTGATSLTIPVSFRLL